MKKIAFIISMFFAAGSLMAQDFSIGPKFGVSQANISVDENNGFVSGDDRLGYHVGLFVRMGGNSFFVQPEILYTNTGGSINQTTVAGPEDVLDANFNRLDIPLMAGFKVLNFFRIQAGPIASILMNYELEQAGQVITDADYSNATIGYQAGIGVDVGNLILDLKYENSLSRIARNIDGFPADQRQNQIILSAGFRLF
jgi:hypothetical protein